MRDMLDTVKEKGAETLVISNEDDLLGQATNAMPIPTAPEWLSPIVGVMPGQIFAMQQAIVRGYEVDKPRGCRR